MRAGVRLRRRGQGLRGGHGGGGRHRVRDGGGSHLRAAGLHARPARGASEQRGERDRHLRDVHGQQEDHPGRGQEAGLRADGADAGAG